MLLQQEAAANGSGEAGAAACASWDAPSDLESAAPGAPAVSVSNLASATALSIGSGAAAAAAGVPRFSAPAAQSCLERTFAAAAEWVAAVGAGDEAGGSFLLRSGCTAVACLVLEDRCVLL